MTPHDGGPACPYCHGQGWTCETHPTFPEGHLLETGEECGGAAAPCPNPGCPDRGKHRIDASIARVEDEA